MKAFIERVAAQTPDTHEQIQAAVMAIIIGLLMMSIGIMLL